jgi:hypothetical protein
VRRVERLNKATVAAADAGQDQLFTTWRHHGFVTNSTLTTIKADETHRDHAIIEQVIAELKSGPLAHAPSGKFTANGAWLTLACLSFNILRAAGAAASARHAKARWATLRTHLITVPARIASSARRLVLHFADRLALGAGLGRPLGHRDHPLTDTRPPRPPRKHPLWKNRTDRRIRHAHIRKGHLRTRRKASTHTRIQTSVDQGSGTRQSRVMPY